MRLFLIVFLVPHVYAARRSHSTRLARRQGFLDQLLPGVLGSSASSAAPTTSILDPVTISPSPTTPVITPTTSTGSLLGDLTGAAGGLVSNVGGAVSTVGSDLGGAVTTVGGGLGSIIGGPVTSTPTATSSSPTNTSPTSNSTSSTFPTSTPTSTSDGGGGIIGGLTSVVGGVTSDLGGGLSTIASDVGSIINPPGPPTSTPNNTPPGSPTQTNDHGPPPTSPTSTPTSSSNDGIIGGLTSVVGGLTSDLGGVVNTVTSDLGSIGGTPTSTPNNTPPGSPTQTNDHGPPPTSPTSTPTSSSNGGIIGGLTSVVGGLTSDLGGVVSTVTSDLGGIGGTPTSDPSASSTSGLGGVIGTLTSDLGGVISTATSDLGGVITSATSGVFPTSSANATVGPTISGTANATSSGAIEPTSIIFPNATSSAQPTISFPTQSSNVSTATTTISQNQTRTSFATTVTSTTVTILSVASELSFVLDESTLAFASVPSTTASPTLTDPDQATASADPLVAQPATTLVAPPLPSGIPGWIYPRQQLDRSSNNLDGYTLISILFNNELNWMFEIEDPISSSQLFVYMPLLITTALDISSDQVKTFALRVYIPDTYHSPSDAAQLGTLYLGYIPNNMVDRLAAQIRVRSSAFYTNGPDDNSRNLAQHVVSSHSLLAVSPNDNPGNGGSSNNSDNNGSSDSGKTREEAIIGVVSALGAIAILVLGFLIYRSYKRRQQLAHRRLSDPPGENLGVRPQGRQFDQDSVGGARRRSFYYAEDSLRGYETQTAPNDPLMAESSTNQRRNVVPGSISAPVLRGSTMNW